MATQSELPAQGYELASELPLFLAFLSSSLFILSLGFFAQYLRRDPSTAVCWKQVAGNVIIVFVVICFPLAGTAQFAFVQCSSLGTVFAQVVPIFLAGLVMERHAESIVGGA